MTQKRHTAAAGPSPAEERVLNAYDVFSRLLTHRPADARKMSYEIEAVALRYVPQAKTQKEQTDDTDRA